MVGRDSWLLGGLTRLASWPILRGMTTILERDGHIVLPPTLRRQRKLKTGDELEIWIDEDEPNVIMLRRKQKSPNEGLAALLRSCPVKGFRIPKRSKELPRDFTL